MAEVGGFRPSLTDSSTRWSASQVRFRRRASRRCFGQPEAFGARASRTSAPSPLYARDVDLTLRPARGETGLPLATEALDFPDARTRRPPAWPGGHLMAGPPRKPGASNSVDAEVLARWRRSSVPQVRSGADPCPLGRGPSAGLCRPPPKRRSLTFSYGASRLPPASPAPRPSCLVDAPAGGHRFN